MTARMTIIEGNTNDKDNVRAYMVKGENGGATWGDINGDINNQTDLINKVDTMIEEELANFEYLDYKVADEPPTPTEVIIGGQTYPTEPGVRYLVQVTGSNMYEEYILIDGVIYDIGSTTDVNLDNYYTKSEVDAITGDLTDLETDTKTDLVSAINEVDANSYYSTSETVCGKFNGVTLYRKVIALDTFPNNGSATYPTGLSNVRIINMYGRAVITATGLTLPLPYVTPSALNQCIAIVYTANNEIAVTTGTDRREFRGVITLEYLKDF